MFKHISAINRIDGMSIEEFRHYWINVHSQIVRGRLPKLRKYLANFPVLDEGVIWPGSAQRLKCDALIELHFDSLEDILGAMQGPEWDSDEQRVSSVKCIALLCNHKLIWEIS
ncbi:EthD domain-containing protein [Burkholderia pseudomallei]|nr:EthD domain-containing protein [Burkholderia pseudomallei]